ncbi:MAG: MotA/TolQ/ExbB proton channel family protein [Pseudomonadota bacterium]
MTAAPAPPPDVSGLDLATLGVTLWDPSALGIVLAGTLIATLARAGFGDMACALRAAAALTRARFDENANRTAIARWARAIRERGVLGAESAMPPDRDLARAIKALLRAGSIKALRAAHDEAFALKRRESERAVRVFEQAGELAPIFGLVGTLFSMTQLAPGAGAESNALTLGAIATAVLSSLYGVLAAHLLFLPLAHAVARRAEREREARAILIEWLAREIADAVPGAGKTGIGGARVTPIKSAA